MESGDGGGGGGCEGCEAARNVMYKANENGLIEIMARKYDRGREAEGKERRRKKRKGSHPVLPCSREDTRAPEGRRHAVTGQSTPARRHHRNFLLETKLVSVTELWEGRGWHRGLLPPGTPPLGCHEDLRRESAGERERKMKREGGAHLCPVGRASQGGAAPEVSGEAVVAG